MRKFVVMHDTEPGFSSTDEAQEWIDHHCITHPDETSRYRIVEILVDGVTEKISDEMTRYKLEQAYIRGKEAKAEEFRVRLGL